MTIRRIFLYANQRFGRWTVLYEVPATNKYRSRYRCRCDCGTTKDVDGLTLRHGTSISCGCFRYESRNSTHGLSKTIEYRIWTGMKKRCYQPAAKAYPRYGGRGIVIADEWRDNPERFIRDMGPRPKGHSIDRIDNNGPYAPSNCRWATPQQQALNTRHNKPLTLNGETLLLSDWARKIGIKPPVLTKRLRRGWSVERTLTTPLC